MPSFHLMNNVTGEKVFIKTQYLPRVGDYVEFNEWLDGGRQTLKVISVWQPARTSYDWRDPHSPTVLVTPEKD